MANVVYSGHVPQNAGFNVPASFPGPTGWTVFKMQQTEIYKITHNLHLKLPPNQLHVVVTPSKDAGITASVAHAADSFTVTLRLPNLGAVQSDFDFVAVYYKKPLKG